MLTGLYPRHHKLVMNGMALPESTPALTHYLSEAGYRTHSVGKQHLQPLLAPAHHRMPDSRAFWDSPESKNWNGPLFGYQTLDLLLGESDTAHLAGHYANWLKNNYPDSVLLLDPASALNPIPKDLDEIWRSPIPVEHHYNSWITDRAVAFLDQEAAKEQPFFLFVSYPDPHHPFDPPAAYADRYDPDSIPLPVVEPGELERMPPYYTGLYPTGDGFRELYWAGRQDLEAGSMIITEGISNDSMRKAIAYTYAMIEMIDDGVGQILSSMDKHGLTENTCIVFTSDHGELLGDHGLLHKGPPPYRQLTEISLLMQGPKIPKGKTVDALTNHIDLAPTLLALAAVTPAAAKFDGLNVMPLLSGQRTRIRSHNFGEYHPSTKPELYNQSVSTERWRLTLYPQKPEWGELFDLENDPHEKMNLFHDASMTQIKTELSAVLGNEFPPQPSVDNQCLCKW